MPMAIDVGHVVAGKYELARLLGRGSMGEVWLAKHRTLGEAVALKLLAPQPEGSEIEDAAAATARFQFEAQIAARLSRKTRHIVRVTDHGQEGGLVYLVMELLDGQTLEARLMRQGRMPMAEVAVLVAQVSRALVEAHAEGVAHRDLKPANIFLTHDEDGRMLTKLLDFGIARAIRAQRMPAAFSTGRGLIFGTPGYMSPEQARASPDLDQRCDLWALATVAYETLTGSLPVPGSSANELLMHLAAGRVVPIRERDPEVPPAIERFFDRAFAQSPDARYPTASDFARAFESATSGQSSARRTAQEEPMPSRLAKTWIVPPESAGAKGRSSRPAWLGLALLAVCTALAMGAGSLAVRRIRTVTATATPTAVATANPTPTPKPTSNPNAQPTEPTPPTPATSAPALASPPAHSDIPVAAAVPALPAIAPSASRSVRVSSPPVPSVSSSAAGATPKPHKPVDKSDVF